MKRGNIRKGEIQLRKTVEAYRNSWGTLYDDMVKFPSGVDGRYLRFKWRAPFSVAVLPETSDHKLILIRTFRHGSQGWSTEIPKGFGDSGSTPLAAAKRELREETGFASRNWSHLGHVLIDPSFMPTRCHLFHAEECKKVSEPEREDSEAIERIEFITPERLMRKIASGRITDMVSCYLGMKLALRDYVGPTVL